MRELYFILGFLFFSGTTALAQSQGVIISEKKMGKRINLYAENVTEDTLKVFLLVKAEGYRRSASRPILKYIAPNTKVPMTTLIEKEGMTSKYTYNLIVNKGNKDFAIHVSPNAIDIKNIVNNRIVVFETPDCEKCSVLKAMLDKEQVAYQVYNVYKDKLLYEKFRSYIKATLPEEAEVTFPVIWNRNQTLLGYNDLEILLSKLKLN